MPRSEQPVRSQSIERTDADGGGLYVECRWRTDRFSHALGVVQHGERQPILMSSAEGEPDEAWPASPPLQQILKQSIHDNPALLGVGMAGAGHWSASFILCDRDSIELIVEMAFSSGGVTERTEDQPALKVTYDLSVSADLVADAGGVRTTRVHAGHGRQLVVSTSTSAPDAAKLFVDRDRLIIQPVAIHDQQPTQWKYRIGCG